jgi:hypothetical protein
LERIRNTLPHDRRPRDRDHLSLRCAYSHPAVRPQEQQRHHDGSAEQPRAADDDGDGVADQQTECRHDVRGFLYDAGGIGAALMTTAAGRARAS